MHLILDIDETCISSIENTPLDRQAVLDPYAFESFDLLNRFNVECTTYVRPHLRQFLPFAASLGVLSFWSAGEKDYVLDILTEIWPEPYMVLWRNHCEQSQLESGCLKSIPWLLSHIPDANIPPILLVDDMKETCYNNGNMAYPIREFNVTLPGAKDDKELLDLENALKTIFYS